MAIDADGTVWVGGGAGRLFGLDPADGHSIYSYASNCSQTEYNVWVTADGSGWRKLANKSQINQPLSGPRIYPVPDGFVLVSGFWEGEPLVVHGVGIR